MISALPRLVRLFRSTVIEISPGSVAQNAGADPGCVDSGSPALMGVHVPVRPCAPAARTAGVTLLESFLRCLVENGATLRTGAGTR